MSHFRAPKEEKKKKKKRAGTSGFWWFPAQEFPKSKLNYSVGISRLEHANSLEYVAKWTDPFQVDHSAARHGGKIYFISW